MTTANEARVLEEIERHLVEVEHLTAAADQVIELWPAALTEAEVDEFAAGLTVVGEEPDAPLPPAAYGLTDAVLDLEIEVAEGERLRDLYARRVELDLDSPKVLRKRLAGQQAAKLHALGQLPAVRALQAANALRLFTIAALTSLALALGWSTFGVHEFAADGALAWTLNWFAGWLVEPFLSLGLLSIVGAKAFFATRGHHVDSPTLNRIENVFLALTLGMNIYPTLPAPVGRAVKFEVPELVLHSLGPIVAVAIVRALPVLWAEFARLDHDVKITADTAATPEYRQNVAVDTTDEPVNDAFDYRVTNLTQDAKDKIRLGLLDRNAKAYRIRAALGCGMDYARAVRARLDQGA
uniref:Uncharacterized protein n=1 Tax=Streptomyces sp. 44030 TaxID=364102 RepID=Q2LEX5_9ACTN|nr:hypothetical protein [Streptomyces sp. 44030]ABC67340.1 hypothetical protein pRL1.11 [Streptomyces sp. 44030]